MAKHSFLYSCFFCCIMHYLLRLPYIGPTLGGVESIIEQPAALFSLDRAERQAAGIKDNLVRYALGIEDADDLIADLSQALEGI